MSCNFNTYKISITNPESYRVIVKDYRKQIHSLMESEEIKYLRDYLSSKLANVILFFYSMLPNASSNVFIQACQVMADELTYPTDDGLPMYVGMYEIILVQMYYDAMARCTSVVVRDEQDRIMHGRTMDWQMGDRKSGLHKMTINVEGYDGEELIFRGVSWAGMVGLFTGTNVKNGFSISINYRPDVRDSDKRLEDELKNIWVPSSAIDILKKPNTLSDLHKELLIAFLRTCNPTNLPCAILVYKVLSGKYKGWLGSYEMTFDLALNMLSSQKLLSRVYFTLAGKDDAYIIARSTVGVDRMESLGPPNLKTHIMVANKDWWDEKSYDLMNSKKRTNIVATNIGSKKKLTESQLESIMRLVVNSLTIYAVIMRPSQMGNIRIFHCKKQ